MTYTSPASATAPLRAAQYVRMSTEHQQYSIANQADVIRSYAAEHNMQIVRTYSDAGKSGLTMQRRSALRSLIADVEKRSTDYSVVLVYDVSRWGRFQDIDESAFYEYCCKRANIAVHYCAEPFTNDTSVSSALLKALKRTMAGEYSRELSTKVFAGKNRLLLAGFRVGGSAGYGLRRLLIDQQGHPKCILKRGELKSIMTDRVLQIPGPPEEIAIIQQIFRWYVDDRLIPQVIADKLNAQQIVSEYGRPWTRNMVHTIVTNPKYIGANVTNRWTYKLGTTGRRNPREKWLVRENTWEPIVDAETFNKAQKVLDVRRKRYTDEDLLNSLKALLDREGKLSVAIIDQASDMANSRIYNLRFGSMFAAYDRVGYKHGRPIPVLELARKLRPFRYKLLDTILSDLTAEGATVRKNAHCGLVTVNNEFTLRLAVVPCIQKKVVGCRWQFRLDSTMKTDIVLIARMAPSNDSVLDYYLLPESEQWPTAVTVSAEDSMFVGVHRFRDLSFLKALVRRVRVKEDE